MPEGESIGLPGVFEGVGGLGDVVVVELPLFLDAVQALMSNSSSKEMITGNRWVRNVIRKGF